MSNNKSRLSESSTMYIMRTIAIVSVLCAHSSFVLSTTIWSHSVSKILLLLGLIGVPIFFINSGYFFYARKIINYKEFFQKKFFNIFIPWVFLTSIVYLYIALRKQGLNYKEYIEFIFGIGNYTYFLTVLLIFYFVFLKVKFTNILIIIGVIISISSSLLTTFGYIPDIDPYINPFNWLIYFLMGVTIRKYNLLLRMVKFIHPYRFFLLIALMLLISYILLEDLYPYYWNPFSYLFILLFIVVAFSFLYNNYNFFIKWIFVGKITLPIYLIHSLFIGSIVYLTNSYSIEFLIPFRPIITLFIVLVVIYLYRHIIKFLRIEKIGLIMMGLNK